VLVVDPHKVLVLELDLHGFRAPGDEVPVLHALVAHARAPPRVLSVCVHMLELSAQQREVLLAQHFKLLIWHGHKARQIKMSRRHVSISP
jgi:hypothetical protein